MKRTWEGKGTALKLIVSMLAILATAVLFNFFPEKVGIFRTATDVTSFTPVLAPEFSVHLPWLNLWWALAFSLCLVRLWMKRWTPALRWADMLLGFFGAYVLARMVLGSEELFLSSIGDALGRYILAFPALALTFSSVRKLQELVNGRWLVFGSDPVQE